MRRKFLHCQPWSKNFCNTNADARSVSVANLLVTFGGGEGNGRFLLFVYYRATLCVSAVFADVCPSFWLSRSYIVSRRLKISSNLTICTASFQFLTLNTDTQSQGEPFSGGVKYTGGRKNLRFSTEITVCFGNGTRQARGCYGTLIGSHR